MDSDRCGLFERRNVMRSVSTLLAAVLAGASGSAAGQYRADTLLEVASAHAQTLIKQLVSVVAEERSVQHTNFPRQTRTLRSEVLLVKIDEQQPWVMFRDVFEVDGKAVHDRDDRLVKLFLDPSTFASRVREITREGVRYNLNTISTLNNPLIAIGFLQSRYRGRFHFVAGQNDRNVGSDVWTLQFREFRTPTILKANANDDLPARGNYWIDMASGRVVKSELQVGPPGINATRITTLFGIDDGLQTPVPVEMQEFYPDFSGTIGTATYTHFRRVEVTAAETIGR
jgi:hypothetical protein